MRLALALFCFAVPLCADEIAAMVDEPDPARRRKAALALARGSKLDLAAWRERLRGFRPAGGGAEGTVEVELLVEGARERTEIALFVPDSAKPGTPAPLLLALHGSGGSGGQARGLWRTVAAAAGAIVVAPTEAGANQGYRFEPRERAAAMAALRWARRRFDVDENRIYVSGVSRGGHMTWDLATRFPDRFAGIAPMVGGPRFEVRRGTNNIRYLENVAHLPIRDLQGEQDHPVMVWSLRYAFARLEKLGARDAQLLTWPDLGHSFRFEAVDWPAFLRGARTPVPGRVVRVATNRDEARAFWVEILAMDRRVKEKFTVRWPGTTFQGLDEAGRRRYVIARADERTARLEARLIGPGVFDVKSTRVTKFRLLLTPEMFDPAEPVRVTWNGRTRTVRVRPDARVLLTEFAERFDRTFLPVAEVTIR